MLIGSLRTCARWFVRNNLDTQLLGLPLIFYQEIVAKEGFTWGASMKKMGRLAPFWFRREQSETQLSCRSSHRIESYRPKSWHRVCGWLIHTIRGKARLKQHASTWWEHCRSIHFCIAATSWISGVWFEAATCFLFISSSQNLRSSGYRCLRALR